MTSAIEIRDVVVRYGDLVALEVDSLRIPAGRVTALIGMNGSGKSTLFKTVVGLVRPVNGTVSIGAVTPAEARAQGWISYVPQSEAVDLAFPVSVRDVVMMGRYGHQGATRRVRPRDLAAVDAALARVQLTRYSSRQIGQLSGGQRKSAFLARGIAQGAAVLLLDEPFAGVDKYREATITALLRSLAESGRTVLVSTHDLQGVPQLADDIVLLNRRVLMHGPVADVLQPDNLARTFGLDIADQDAAP